VKREKKIVIVDDQPTAKKNEKRKKNFCSVLVQGFSPAVQFDFIIAV